MLRMFCLGSGHYLRGGGGATYGGGGGEVKLYSYKRGAGEENVLAMLKGGGWSRAFEVVLTRVLEVLAILIGGEGAKGFNPFKGGRPRQV